MIKRAPSAKLRAELALQLRAARIAAGKTQTEVAKAVAMNQGHLSAIERGHTNIPIDTLSDLAAALGRQVVITLVPITDQRLIRGKRPIR